VRLLKAKQPIKTSDIASIEKTLLKLINSFPELPAQVVKDGVFFQNLKPQNISLGFSTIPRDSVVDETWICGSYFGFYHFRLILQKMSVTNDERIDAQDILGLLSAWLSKVPIQGKDGVFKLKKYPELENNMSIIKIEIISFPRLIDRLPPNIELHEARLRLKYFVRKSFF
jgi:hypothetical protein